MVKLSGILIAVAFVGVIVFGLGQFLAEGNTIYTPTGYNNSSLQFISNINKDITNITNQTQEKISKLQSNTNIVNILDLAVTQTFDAAKIVAKSADSVLKISFESQKATAPYLGDLSNPLFSVLGTAVLVIIAVALLMHFIIKSDRL